MEPQGASLPSPHAYRTRNVFVVSIDGLRATEAFEAPNPADFIPNMNRLRQSGSLYRNVYNLSATWTTPANYSIVDGCLELTAPSMYYYRHFRPRFPTMFEYYRRANPDVPPEKVWAVVGERDCTIIGFSSHPYYGEAYAASVDETTMNEERADERTWSALQRRMDQYHPSLVFLQLGGIGLQVQYGWGAYLDGIKKADAVVNALWDKIQSDPYYRDQTTLLVTASQGRHDDQHGGFRESGGICEGCKHVFLLALGPDITAGAKFFQVRQLTDICPTVGELMGFDTPLCEGRVLGEMIVGYEARSPHVPSSPTADMAWPDESRITNSPGLVEQPRVAVNGSGLHLVWVDNRSGQRQVYYKTRSSSGEWSDDLQLSLGESEARAPAIAVDGDTVHVVWQDYQPGNWAIYHRQRAADGQWSAPDLVAESVEEGRASC